MVAAVALAAAAAATGAQGPTPASLAGEESSLGAQIAAQSQEIDGVERRIATLGSEVARLEAALAGSRQRLIELDAELERQGREVRRLRGELATSHRRLANRMVDLYEGGGSPGTLEIVLGAASLGDALDGLELHQRVLEQDESIVGDVRSGRAAVAAARRRTRLLRREQRERVESLREQTARRRASYEALVARRDQLAALRAERRAALVRVRAQQSALLADARALAAADPQVASAAQTAAPASTPAAAAGSTGFIWPVSGPLLSPFGMRGGRMHSGIDIGAPAGSPIAASAAGTVTYSGSMSGYGLIVVVQHAGGVATAYAHNSRNNVSVGQVVAQGQTIGAVGCTGRCFGDHVHFEVRVNGAAVDPMAYL